MEMGFPGGGGGGGKPASAPSGGHGQRLSGGDAVGAVPAPGTVWEALALR